MKKLLRARPKKVFNWGKCTTALMSLCDRAWTRGREDHKNNIALTENPYASIGWNCRLNNSWIDGWKFDENINKEIQ